MLSSFVVCAALVSASVFESAVVLSTSDAVVCSPAAFVVKSEVVVGDFVAWTA